MGKQGVRFEMLRLEQMMFSRMVCKNLGRIMQVVDN